MAQVYELNLRDYWNIFRKRKWTIVLSLSLVLVGTIVYTNFQPMLYKTGAIIKIEVPEMHEDILFPTRRYYFEIADLGAYQTALKSPLIIEKAIKESGLIDADASPEEFDYLVRYTASNLTTTMLAKTNMIEVELVSTNPKQIAIIVNKITQVFKEENKKRINIQTQEVREFIEQQLGKIKRRLSEAEDRLKALTLKGAGTTASSITDEILKLESRRTDLLTKFTERHPEIIMIDEQVAILKEQLKKLPKEEFEYVQAERDVRLNVELYNDLSARLQEARIKEAEKRDNVVLISPAAAPLRPFSPNKTRNYFTGITLGLVLGIAAGMIFEHLDTSIGRTEDLEEVAKVSVIGIVPYYVAKEKDVRDVIQRLGIKNIFRVRKKVKKEDRLRRLKEQLLIRHRGSSVFLESFRILAANTQVVFGEGERIKGKCILITSANPQEGKSIITANLSVIMAQMGYKTVLVDTDLRRSSQHKIFGLEKKDKGVTDILTGEASVDIALKVVTDLLLGDLGQDELLKHPWLDNFHLITAGTTFPNYPYLLNTERMNKFLTELRERFEVIIMDSSPVLAVSDTSILVPKADGVFLVYRAGTTSRIALRRAKLQIESAKGKGALKGVILNNVTPEVTADTYYYYRGRYYKEKEEYKDKEEDKGGA